LVVPTFQPLLSSLFRWLSRIVILLEAATRYVDHLFWGRFGFLSENLKNQYYVSVYSINNSPVAASVHNAQLMATPSNARQPPRLWHSKGISSLQLAQQESCLNPGCLGKWRSFHLAMKPNKGFVLRAHMLKYMSALT
jgi:hypothetical protein